MLPAPCIIAAIQLVVLLAVSSSTTQKTVLLQFDGSSQLRRCNSRSSIGGDEKQATRISTCSACLFVNGKLQGLGGRQLPIVQAASGEKGPSWSSAIVEYEGLLYGLEQLVNYCDRQCDHLENKCSSSTSIVVVVQGDCKTVMEQMQGRARPRKLDLYHQRAMSICKNNFFGGRNNNRSIVFEHIPREQNGLADELAQCIATQCQISAIREFIDRLQAFPGNNSNNFSIVDDDDDFLIPLSCLDVSTKLVGLQCLAQLSYQNHCYTNLLTILDYMESFLSRDSQKHDLYHVDDETFQRDLAVQAYLYRRHAYEALGQRPTKELARFHRTTKHFVRNHADSIGRMESAIHQTPRKQATGSSIKLSKQMETNIWSRSGLNDQFWSPPVQFWCDDVTTTKPSWQMGWSHWVTLD